MEGVSVPLMAAQPASDIIADTIRHLEQQRDRGVRFVRVEAGLLEGWQTTAFASAPRAPQPTGRKPAVPSIPLKTPSPAGERPPMTQDRRAAFAALRARALECQKCPHLVRFRKQVVFGVGNPNAELMFVGEAPGADEDQQGEPFVGRAGQLLTKMIQAMGFERSDVYIGNVLKCRPDVETTAGNRKPTPSEMATCIPYLKEQIQLIQPRALVALGDTATKGLAPDLKDPIGKLRGRWLTFEGIPLMPTFHPAYLLRNQSLALKRLCWEDMLAVLEKLGTPITARQHGYFLSALAVKGPAEAAG